MSGGDGGDFGTWIDDPPAFSLRADPPERDVWHQIGNDRLTATAHLAGYVTVYSTDAGVVRLSSPRPSDRNLQGSRWAWLSGDGGVIAANESGTHATWETGAASWTSEGIGWTLTRRVWIPFGSEPVVRIDVELVTRRNERRGGTFVEHWGFSPLPLVIGGLMAPFTRPPEGYDLRQRLGWIAAFSAAQGSRSTINTLRRCLGWGLHLRTAAGTDPKAGVVVLTTRRAPRWLREGRPSRLAALPARIVLASLDQHGCIASVRTVATRGPLTCAATAVQLRTRLPAAERVTVSYAVGLVDHGTDPRQWIARQRRTCAADSRRSWRSTFQLTTESEPALEREMAWHAGMLRSAQVAEPVFGSSYVAQGAAYAYVNGLHGAVRDYAHFLIPLCLIDPAGAKSMLLTMLALQRRDGSLAYAHTGAGWRTSALIHPESTDLPLCLLWAAVEYVRMSGDMGLLDIPVPWHPCERPGQHVRRAARSAVPGQPTSATPASGETPLTVGERILLAWRHLDEAIGRGPHGLIRIGSGDWNDPLRAMAADRRAFRRRGESVYNSALAAYVLPRAAELLAGVHPTMAQQMRHRADDLRAALRHAWTGRWFLRAWDGRGGRIGHDRIFLDSNAWCLIAQVGTPTQRQHLIEEIAARLDDPSPIGALSLDRPVRVRGGILAPGWDTNGGVWPALNALLAWGYALHDRDRALALLHRMTFAEHARTYPKQWSGIWSGPDAFNAHHAAEPGGTYVQPATPMAEFPVMNANAHAGPLLALVKVLGLESDADGFAVRRAGPIRAWELETALGSFAQPPGR